MPHRGAEQSWNRKRARAAGTAVTTPTAPVLITMMLPSGRGSLAGTVHNPPPSTRHGPTSPGHRTFGQAAQGDR